MTNDKSDQVINPFAHVNGVSWWLTQKIYDTRGVCRSLKSGEGTGNIPKILLRYE